MWSKKCVLICLYNATALKRFGHITLFTCFDYKEHKKPKLNKNTWYDRPKQTEKVPRLLRVVKQFDFTADCISSADALHDDVNELAMYKQPHDAQKMVVNPRRRFVFDVKPFLSHKKTKKCTHNTISTATAWKNDRYPSPGSQINMHRSDITDCVGADRWQFSEINT